MFGFIAKKHVFGAMSLLRLEFCRCRATVSPQTARKWVPWLKKCDECIILKIHCVCLRKAYRVGGSGQEKGRFIGFGTGAFRFGMKFR